MAATAILQLDPRRPNLFSASPATLTDVNGTNIPIAGAAFNDTTVQDIFFEFKASKYLSGSLIAKISWYSTTAQTSGAVVFGTQMAALAAGAAQSVLTDALATANTTTTTVNATASGPNTTTITISNTDSLATDGTVQLRIFRDASNGVDTMTGNALIFDVELSWTIAGGAITNAGSGTDNAVVRFDLNGQTVQNSGVIIDDSNNVTGIAALTASGIITGSRFVGFATGIRETNAPTDLNIGGIDTQQYLKRSGTDIIGVDFLRSVLVADSAGITTTLTTVLNLNLQAGGRIYIFECHLVLVNSTATANVVTININGAGGVTAIGYSGQGWIGTGTAVAQVASVTNNTSITLSPSVTTPYYVRIAGTIEPSGGGNLNIGISRATSGTVVAKRGSYLKADEA